MLSRSKLLRRARSSRRLHITIVDTDEVIPPMPTSPIEEAIQARQAGSSSHSDSLPLPPVNNNSFHHHRQASCSSSRVSSSWSSSSSTCSTSSSTSSSRLAWDPLRLNPTDSFVDEEDSSSSIHPGFDFGFGAPRYHAARELITPVSSRDYDDDSFVQGLSAPPPRHQHRLRAPQSDMCLRRPSTASSSSDSFAEPSSPVRPRMQPVANETEHMLKRGDWKRRGIIFGEN